MGNATTNSCTSYRIFISFTSADVILAEYLASELRRILDDYNAVYCFTKPGTQNSLAGSRPADDFMKRIDSSLSKCNVFILLWSENSKRANGVKYEFNHARRLLMQNVRRMGREFKIIPICIDKCGLPFSLKSIVRITHISGSDPQVTLNQVLKGLGLQAEHADPQIVFLKGAVFEIKTAFRDNEWEIVLQKYSKLAQQYPAVITAEMHYRYAIAHLRLGHIPQSLMAAHEGLSLENKEDDAPLLEQFLYGLKEKRLWNELLTLLKQAAAKFPTDARWLQLQWEIPNRTNDSTPFFFTPR